MTATIEIPSAEATEEAAETQEERAAGDAGRRSIAGDQAEGEAVDIDERNHRGPSDEGGYAREAGNTTALGDERGPRSKTGARAAGARPGQRRLGARMAPARPGPLAGWEQHSTQPRAPAAVGDNVCPSSTRHLEAQEERRESDERQSWRRTKATRRKRWWRLAQQNEGGGLGQAGRECL
ncbi:unnamed protein product [Closterium sp. NIES-53]